MIITIHDDFNLQRIIDSGQCFRPVKIPDGRYRFITGKHLLHIQELGDGRYEVDCSRWNWKHTWKPYFDLNASYAAIRRSIPDSDTYLTWAAEYSQGIRILRQDPWEMIITFIISQRKSIPAIRSAVEMLCEKAGTLCEEGGENFYTFPRPGELARLSEEDLRECSLGYRAPYIYQTVRKVRREKINLYQWNILTDEKLVEKLMEFPGVGIKVANCTALFGYHRIARAPVDVWIERVIREHYGGQNPFVSYPETAGIMQQYMFYYIRNGKKMSRTKMN
uniref:DNA-3-methyladenine glycosylase family protein n=1 Tax=uncultured Allisonella sp. TaxID=339338 RepID=UPI002805C98D|nr:DNA glycosylase [uncultured Allisonella sp.]